MEMIGVIHLLPLPGSPRAMPMANIIAGAEADALAYIDGGVDGLIIENFGDMPLVNGQVEPLTVAAMTLAIQRVREMTGGEISIGVNVLRNDALSAMSIAHVCGADFIRVNVHVGATLTDQGIIQGDAAQVLRLRSRLNAGVAIWADVDVKHASPLTPYSHPIREAEDAVYRGLADALIVTGKATGYPLDPELPRAIQRRLPHTKMMAGSGVQPKLIPTLRGIVDGVIVGTWVKKGGVVSNPVDKLRVAQLRNALDSAE